jgi:predicted DNA-binding protein with PD1-like motif
MTLRAALSSLAAALTLAACGGAQRGAVRSEVRAIVVRLRPGDDLKRELDALARREDLAAAAIATCVGSVERVTVRYADRRDPVVLEGRREIVSLVGTLARDGSHLHVAVSDGEGRTVGGHLMDGSRVYTTAEVVVLVFPDVRYARELDPTYGYHELVVRPR